MTPMKDQSEMPEVIDDVVNRIWNSRHEFSSEEHCKGYFKALLDTILRADLAEKLAGVVKLALPYLEFNKYVEGLAKEALTAYESSKSSTKQGGE